MLLFETPFYRFELENQILRFIWKKTSGNLDYQYFKESCMVYAGFVVEYQTEFLLINTIDLKIELPLEFSEWKGNYLNPRYEKVPVRKLAFILDEKPFGYLKNQKLKEGMIENRYFNSNADATKWLLA